MNGTPIVFGYDKGMLTLWKESDAKMMVEEDSIIINCHITSSTFDHINNIIAIERIGSDIVVQTLDKYENIIFCNGGGNNIICTIMMKMKKENMKCITDIINKINEDPLFNSRRS